MQDEQTQVCGVVVIQNMIDVGLLHARNMDHRAAKLFTSVIQVALHVLWHRIVSQKTFKCVVCKYA